MAEAAAVVKAIGGRAPVHLVWTREDDLRGGYYRPMVLHQAKVGLYADGRIAGWQHKIVSQPITIGTPFEPKLVNPDVVTAKIEGAVGFALSAVLRNRVTLNKGMIEQSNFHNYEPTRMHEMPGVEVHIVASNEAPSGIGEPGVPPLAPAIGNALFAATGKRLFSLPLQLTG